MNLSKLLAAGLCLTAICAQAAVVKVGSGSYSDSQPNLDGGVIGDPVYVTSDVASNPIPTSDWWTKEIKEVHADNLFNYPLAVRPGDSGLCIQRATPGEGMAAVEPLGIYVDGLTPSATKVSAFTDWTFTLNWSDGQMEAIVGQGMPMVYFTKTIGGNVKINFMGTGNAQGNILIITNSFNNSNYAVYAPTGATWTVNGSTATSNLAGKNYWSAMLLPDGANANDAANYFANYAFAFPTDTRANGTYEVSSGKVITDFTVTVRKMEGNNDLIPMGLLPHQWGNLAPGSAQPSNYIYSSARGKLHLLVGNKFTTQLQYYGLIPSLPNLTDEATGFNFVKFQEYVDAVIANTGLQDYTDSYNDGLLLNRLAQTARAAKEAGYIAGYDKLITIIKNHLQRWFTTQEGDTDFCFYYLKSWGALVAGRQGHGQASNLNDHHFHWGYYIQAAATVAEADKQWMQDWGGMVDLLIRDVAAGRDDSMFPFMRNFNPYAGHSFANGMSTDPVGADQESTSESMNFSSAMIQWAGLRGDNEMLNRAVWLYTTERSAIEEYWFNANGRGFYESYNQPIVGILKTNSNTFGTYWSADPGAVYGIQLVPTQASTMYVAENLQMAKTFWNNAKNATNIMNGVENDDVWYDIWARFVASFDADEAINMLDVAPENRKGSKFGESYAHTYYYVHDMKKLGAVTNITADYPYATSFSNSEGKTTYVAQNYSSEPIIVHFSDGGSLTVAPNSLGTSQEKTKLPATLSLSLSRSTVKPGENIEITLEISQGDQTITKSEILVNGQQIKGANSELSYSCEWTAPETDGDYTVTAEATDSEGKVFTSAATVITVKTPASSAIPAAPAPAHDAANVMSLFSGAYTSVVPGMFPGSWGQSTVCETVDCDGDDAYMLTNFNYMGFQFSGSDDVIDATAMTTLHIDIYGTADMTLNFYPISLNPTVDNVAKSLHILPGRWNSFDIPLTDFAGVDFAALGQFKMDGGAGQTLYLDNIYMWTGQAVAPSRDATLTLTLSHTEARPGDVVTFDLAIDQGDHTILSSAIKVNGETVASKDHSARATLSHTHQWTAPQAEGSYTVLAEAVNSEGRTFTSAAQVVNVKAASVNPPVGDDGGCTFTGTSAAEGTFKGDYNIRCTTLADGDVQITASFEGAYDGFAGPWLQNITDGFAETAMTAAADNTYTATLSGYPAGSQVKFRVKIAFASGLAVTSDCTYTVGNTCSTTSIDDVEMQGVAAYPNPVRDTFTITLPGQALVEAWSFSGIKVYSAELPGSATIDASAWPQGMYIIRVQGTASATALSIIKK